MPKDFFPNAKPSDDYTLLRKQFGSLKTMLNCVHQQLSFYQKKDYSLNESRLNSLEKSIESEREMNATLTDENQNLTRKLEIAEKALDWMVENSHESYETCASKARQALVDIRD